MNDDIKKELNKIYKLTGIKLSIENEDEVSISALKKISTAYKEKYSSANILLNILNGIYPDKEQAHALQSLNIKPDTKMRLYLIYVPTKIDETIKKIITSLFPGRSSEYLCSLDSTHLCFLYLGEDNIAHPLLDVIETEGMTGAYIAYSDIFSDTSLLQKEYLDLRQALLISEIFCSDKKLISPNDLGTGELIYNIPRPVCEKFLKRHFGGVIDDESMQLATTFIHHNLSIAETSRYMHMHRNTLVYRLEQIEKKYGIDIKTFEGADIFNIAILITNFLKVKNNE
ncbi:PucR family transcriptional regulator [Lachnoanaerobaculum orale]|jgi:hypothetical protein|uniref:PucR family transcriptional regulator n=1 Tax=Lachnoanaerobaculum orale TaxID=979627 RepID=UPI0023A89AB1|nr:helix-turn-helix domain-containing protein [Lachnoanaerobaculum orale]